MVKEQDEYVSHNELQEAITAVHSALDEAVAAVYRTLDNSERASNSRLYSALGNVKIELESKIETISNQLTEHEKGKEEH